jgi:SAM-dependent methyltransferase
MMSEDYEFERKQLSLEDFDPEGRILDLGGGGEGVIGLFGRPDQVSIDMRMDELLEAPVGPLKVVMDARRLALPEACFDTVTAFFSLMYIGDTGALKRVFAEAYRVLRPGGTFHIWDANLPEIHIDATAYFVVWLEIVTPTATVGTGYGASWPDAIRDEAYYRNLAMGAGLEPTWVLVDDGTFYMEVRKPN